MSEIPATPSAPRRNPGPGWGYAFLCAADRVLPEIIFRPARALGTWVALAVMREERGHSRAYLRVILGREPALVEVFRHFFAFGEMLMAKLRVANGQAHRGILAETAHDFRAFLRGNAPAFLGTLHFANSDLSGFLFGGQEKRRVALIRQRVGNSGDTERLGGRFSEWVAFIWVNEGDSLLFALKDALAAGYSIALKCDRLEFSAKTEAFRFLGARRIFPFTIYHLALIFGHPVLLSLGLPAGPGATRVESSPAWRPDPALSRADNLESARRHFQAFLERVESLLRDHPYWWFNFIPLNPEAHAA
jgi:predicted LPLAT superfamily acyltransferase